MFLTPTLTVNLSAIVANWQRLRAQFTGRETAAVVKADAYGLGMVEVSTALAKAGCDTFCVATLSEAISLRAALADVRILVFHGVQPGEEFAFRQHRLIPALSSMEQLQRWKPVAAEFPHAVSALHIDTGMARLGLQMEEFTALLTAEPTVLEQCRVGLIMSHFACAPEPLHPSNAHQRDAMQRVRDLVGASIPLSLCNSGGIYLGTDYHCDLARPGCALYGIAPQDSAANPMQPVVQWDAPIISTRVLEHAQSVGYGATQTLPKGTRLATVASGYADGYLRHASGQGAVGYVGEYRVPLVGRVTMDMLCFDVSSVPETLLGEGQPLTLLGNRDGIRVDDLARITGTIGYEVLTRIGPRVRRVYL